MESWPAQTGGYLANKQTDWRGRLFPRLPQNVAAFGYLGYTVRFCSSQPRTRFRSFDPPSFACIPSWSTCYAGHRTLRTAWLSGCSIAAWCFWTPSGSCPHCQVTRSSWQRFDSGGSLPEISRRGRCSIQGRALHKTRNPCWNKRHCLCSDRKLSVLSSEAGREILNVQLGAVRRRRQSQRFTMHFGTSKYTTGDL